MRSLRHAAAALAAVTLVASCAAADPASSPPPSAATPTEAAPTQPPEASPSTTPSDAAPTHTPTGDSDPDAASQSAADAQRDGVLPEVAALTFEQRVEVREPGAGGLTVRAETDEGVWVVSRMPSEAIELADGCGIGATDDPDAVYRRDVICTVEYGEVLLLDHGEDRILRAFPLPGVPPHRLEISDDAVWCARRGDGALPDGMLCRIDRDTYDWQVRIFPPRTGSGLTGAVDAASGVDPATGELWLPAHWTVDTDADRLDPAHLTDAWSFDGQTLVAGGVDGVRFDPTTLAPARARE